MLNHPTFASWPSFSEEEGKAVKDILLSNKVNYWTGDECRQFEKEFAEWSGVNYSIALANGTLALEVVLRALDIGPGDEVVVTPRTFIASISCVVNVGATPIFADVDPDSGNITAETISKVLTSKTNYRPYNNQLNIDFDITVAKDALPTEPSREFIQIREHEYREQKEELSNAIRILKMTDEEVVNTSTYNAVARYL